MAKSHVRLLLVAASAAAAGLLAGCGSGRTVNGAVPEGRPTVLPAPTTGLVPAPRELTDRLVLRQTHVTAGTAINGTVIVTYRGRAPVNLNRRCLPYYAVALMNRRFPPFAAFRTDCSSAPFLIRPGQNRLAVTVVTTYQACSEVARQATRSSPACLPGGRMPPLLPGRYEAVLVGDALPLPAPAPVPVSLTKAR